jgi:hypothetical protein
MTFKPYEIEFMHQADLGRLATIGPDGTPHRRIINGFPLRRTQMNFLGIDVALRGYAGMAPPSNEIL